LFEVSNTGTLPSGTRRIHIAISHGASYLVADDISFTLAAPVGPPVIMPAGIISAGAFGAFTSVALESWIEIYFSNLTSSAPLGWSKFVNGVGATMLGDGSVSVRGRAAYIDSISPRQVNALISSDAPTGPVAITLTNANDLCESDAAWAARAARVHGWLQTIRGRFVFGRADFRGPAKRESSV
jgi:hypothetical protein